MEYTTTTFENMYEDVYHSGTAKKIWDYFMTEHRIGNPYGVAGLIGNLQYESMLNSSAVSLCDTKDNQNPQWTKDRDELYYHVIPAGGMFFSMNDFVLDKSISFGLAGWQWWARKQGLYNNAKIRERAVCDLDVQLAFIWDELTAPSKQELLVILRNAGSVKEASDAAAEQYIRDQIKVVHPDSLPEREVHAIGILNVLQSEKDKRAKGIKKEQANHKVKWAIAIRDGVPIRTKPMPLSKTLGRAYPDERYRYIISSKNKKWHCVYWPFGDELGWIPARYAKIVETDI